MDSVIIRLWKTRAADYNIRSRELQALHHPEVVCERNSLFSEVVPSLFFSRGPFSKI